jgi:hypothetical protein
VDVPRIGSLIINEFENRAIFRLRPKVNSARAAPTRQDFSNHQSLTIDRERHRFFGIRKLGMALSQSGHIAKMLFY